MKKVAALAMAVVLVAGLAGIASARGRWGGYGMGMGYGPGSCWEDRDSDDRPASRRGGGRGFGPEACPNCPNFEGEARFGTAVEKSDDAAEIVAGFIERTGNPYLKVGKVEESGRDFEVEIVTKDGSLANKVFVEKRTGRMIPAYR